jgi:PAT family beta-lactamase induction signal transducer AmpG
MSKSRNPVTWVPTVYFAMGLPFVVLNMVSVLMFKGLGVSDAQIALWTSVIMLPWTLKFLWSPFLELYKTKKFFVVLTQIITGLGFALVALALQAPFFFAACIALLAVIALSGATHDVVTDGVYMSELDKQQQARYIGWQGAFYNIAKIVASGGLVWLAGWLLKSFGGVKGATEAVRYEATTHAWMTVMLILAAVMILLSLYHIRMLPSGGKAAQGTATARNTLHQLLEVIRDFFRKKHIWYYIAFIILYRFAEGFVMKIVPLFLKADRAAGGLGLDEQQIGLYYGTYGAAAFVLGSLLAGYYISYRGLKRTLFPLCCIFNLPFVAYTLLAVYQPENALLIGGGIVLEYFGYGFGFVGLMLFMMQQVAPGKHQMAHYAFASGIMNLGVMLPGSISGFVSDWLGYQAFFVFILFATIPAFLITWFVPFREEEKELKKEIEHS